MINRGPSRTLAGGFRTTWRRERQQGGLRKAKRWLRSLSVSSSVADVLLLFLGLLGLYGFYAGSTLAFNSAQAVGPSSALSAQEQVQAPADVDTGALAQPGVVQRSGWMPAQRLSQAPAQDAVAEGDGQAVDDDDDLANDDAAAAAAAAQAEAAEREKAAAGAAAAAAAKAQNAVVKQADVDHGNSEVIAPFTLLSDDPGMREKQMALRGAMEHAWQGYKKYCWGQDELRAAVKTCENGFNMGLTIIDALDTLHVMGMVDEWNEARAWVAESLTIPNRQVSFFETNIRVLGGFLSAYELSNDGMFLEKALEVGEGLTGAFSTPSGLPVGVVNLKTKSTSGARGQCVLAEVGTIQLEFKTLSHLTGNTKFFDLSDGVINKLDKLPKTQCAGCYPMFLSSQTGEFISTHVSYGAMGDSFYEYLLKQWIQGGKKDDRLKRMYNEATQGLFEKMYQHNAATTFFYLADLKGSSLEHKMDELACFTGGMLALGVHSGIVPEDLRPKHMDAAEELARTCYHMFVDMKGGVAPEFVTFSSNGMHVGNADFYILRPETVETMFYLWRITKNPKYREWGWKIFQNIEAATKTADAGYSAVLHVDSPNPEHDRNGKMHSFLLAETFKYLYLLFSPDDLLSIDDFVFGTEAHPFRVFQK